jgi:hypothetical protein
VQNGYHCKLPTPAKAKVEWQSVQHTMNEQMIPILTLRISKEWTLEEIISHKVTHY